MREIWKELRYYRTSSGILQNYPEYEISNYGNIRNKETMKLAKHVVSKNAFSNDYPYVIIRLNNQKVIKLLVHIALISSFKKVPKEPNYQVDHIDRNKQNFNLNNLRFLSISDNNKNREIIKRDVLFKDVNKSSFIVVKQDCLTILKELKLLERTTNISYESLLDLFNRHTWVELTDTISISDLGIIRRKTKSGFVRYSTGCLDSHGYYKFDFPSEYSILVHVTMAQIFLNNGVKLIKGQEVDHIDGNTRNNQLENLRIVSRSENMKNAKRLLKPIKCKINNVVCYFRSGKDMASLLNVSPKRVSDWAIGKYKCTLSSITALSFASEQEKLDLLEGKLQYFESPTINFKSTRNNPSREFTTIDELNEFLEINKISSRKDLINQGLEHIYKYACYRDWISKLKYYGN